MSVLENGYQSLLPGKIASVVTYLEMHARPARPTFPLPEGFTIRRMHGLSIAAYREVFRAVGEQWLWFSRLVLPDSQLAARLADPAMEVHFLLEGERACGMIELDRRQFPDIELVLFGLTPDRMGRGIGNAMMSYACDAAWSHNPRRFWLHTCTLDSPKALGFYIHCGFTPFKRAVEVADDPRLSGILPRTAAPQVPLL